MKQVTTFFLKAVIWIMGITVLALCTYWLPWQANVLAEMYPEFIHLKYPLLIGIFLTTIPYFFALYQAFKLLSYIDRNKAFSKSSVKSLLSIKYSALTISILYIIGFIMLLSQGAGNPGILLLGLVIIFASVVLAIFAAILQMLLHHAIDIKTENELTV
jgi:hypothetical protein